MRALIQSTRVALLPALVAAVAVSGCDTKEPTGPKVTGVELARGGGAAPKVDSTDPPGAEQETTLDVRVLGSGFDDGSQVAFLLNGDSVTTMQTNSVTFVSRKELRANLTIDLEAAIDLYDVEVYTRGGKRGIGADLFHVAEKGSGNPFPPTPDLVVTFRSWFEDGGLTSSDPVIDAIGADRNESYIHDVDNVIAQLGFWLTTDEGNRGAHRSVCFDFSDSVSVQKENPFANDPILCTPIALWHTVDGDGSYWLTEFEVGTEKLFAGDFRWVGDGATWFLTFPCVPYAADPPTSCDGIDGRVRGEGHLVKRISADTWTIEPGPHHTIAELWKWPDPGRGKPVGKTLLARYNMPFLATLTLK
jgi:hypothetical protein